MGKRRTLAFVLVVGFLGATVATGGPASGAPVRSTTPPDAVIEWSTRAQVAIVDEAGFSPPEAAVLMGIVHVAIYDAVVAVEGGGRPYAVKVKAPDGASPEAAAAAASHGVLVGLLPDQQATLDAGYSAYLATLPGGRSRADGTAVGEEVAEGILALRAGDGRDAVVPYVQAPTGPGVYEPTAPFPPVLTHLGGIEPLVLRRADMFRPPGPARRGPDPRGGRHPPPVGRPRCPPVEPGADPPHRGAGPEPVRGRPPDGDGPRVGG